jgi:hypothetical protein
VDKRAGRADQSRQTNPRGRVGMIDRGIYLLAIVPVRCWAECALTDGMCISEWTAVPCNSYTIELVKQRWNVDYDAIGIEVQRVIEDVNYRKQVQELTQFFTLI